MAQEYITKIEKGDVEAVIEYGSYGEAARRTGRTVRAITQSFYRVREKYQGMKSECNWVENSRRKLGPKRRLLTS